MAAASRAARRAARRVAFLGLAYAAVVGAAGTPEVGRPAPAFSALQLDGRPFDLAAQHGKVVIVNFWASWCGPCRAEMPLLNAYYQRHRAQGLELIGVSVDDPQDRREVLRIMQQFSYPAVLASSAKVNGFGPPLAVPISWIIDANGVVRARLLAARGITAQSLDAVVLPLLPPLPGGAH